MKSKRIVLIFVMVIGLVSANAAFGQQYVLEPGDRISVTFWQEPNLNSEVVVDTEGKIELPVISSMTAAGLTVAQLSAKIAEKMSIFNPNVNQALVKVVEYGSKRIWVTGAVSMPGVYTFEQMPNIWEAILRGGGPLENAKMTQVTIFRGGKEFGQTIPVDLTQYFSQGDLARLPELRPNDNVFIPSEAGAAQGGVAGAASRGLFNNAELIYVYGYVVAPGRYELEPSMDVLQAIIKAGGPLIVGANRAGLAEVPDLQHVKIITSTPEGPISYEIDLDNYAQEAVPRPLLLKVGDTIYVPGKFSSKSFLLANVIRPAVTGAVTIIVSYFLLDKLLANNNNP